jgi:UDP-glucose 4-epimerase
VHPTGVIHLAATRSPTESTSDPLLYAEQNVGGVISPARAMRDAGLSRVVFSSSCSGYGPPADDAVDEDAAKHPVSPYGESKLYGERLLTTTAGAYGWGATNLRYFNVGGAAEPGLRPTGAHNLVPLVFEALRRCIPVRVFGEYYSTPVGIRIRGYVDVEGLADAHVGAAAGLDSDSLSTTYNVGRGEGSSVLGALAAAEKVTGGPVPYAMDERPAGDPARLIGRVHRITRDLGRRARRDLVNMLRSTWKAIVSEEPGCRAGSG